MEVDVKIAGASYSGVPAVLLPLADGGKARFCEVSDTTAVASDVATGKKFYSADGTLTTGTNTRGGSTGDGLPTYTITIPKSDHQAISVEVSYKASPTISKTLTATGTASNREFITTNPYITGITHTADDGYIKGKLTPSLTLPYEITEDITFSVTDAEESTFTWPDVITLTTESGAEWDGTLQISTMKKKVTSQTPDYPTITALNYALGQADDGVTDQTIIIIDCQDKDKFGTINATISANNAYSPSEPFTGTVTLDYMSDLGIFGGVVNERIDMYSSTSITITKNS